MPTMFSKKGNKMKRKEFIEMCKKDEQLIESIDERLIVCGWVSREELSDITGKKISLSEYARFRIWLSGGDLKENCEDMVREEYDRFEEEEEIYGKFEPDENGLYPLDKAEEKSEKKEEE